MRYHKFSLGLSIVLLLGIKASMAQVDITRYASDDLFSVKPIITKEYLEKNQKEKESEFPNYVELEIEKGMEYWAKEQYDDALDLFTQLAEEYNDGMFFYYLGVISYERERYQEATEYLYEAIQKEPLLLDATYMLGMVALADNDTRTAKIHFKTLEEIPTYESYGQNGLALVALNTGNYSVAAIKFKKCISIDSTFLEAYPPLVRYYLTYGKYKSARNLVEKALRIDPKWQEGIIIRGMVSMLQDESTDQFEKDINTLIELDPNNYHYYSIKGFLHSELGQYHAAISMFHTALNLELDSTRIGALKFSSKMKKNESMQRSLNYYFEHKVVNQEVRKYLDRGICELFQNNRNNGIAYLDSANAIEENAITYMFIGSARKNMWLKTEEAINAYSKSIELDSMNWRAFSYRADCYLNMNENLKSFEDYSRVIDLRPKTKEGYKNRGNILAAHGQYQLAYKDFSMALAIDQSDYDVFFNRAVALINLGKYSHSMSDLNFILSHKPDDGEAYYLLKVCYQNQKDTLKSIQFLDSASLHEKYKIRYHEELLELATRYSREDLCIAAHDRLVKYNSYNYKHRLNRAKYLYNSGHYERAISDLEKYVKKNKESGEGYFYLASALQKLGHLKSSEKYFRKAEKLGHNYFPAGTRRK